MLIWQLVAVYIIWETHFRLIFYGFINVFNFASASTDDTIFKIILRPFLLLLFPTFQIEIIYFHNNKVQILIRCTLGWIFGCCKFVLISKPNFGKTFNGFIINLFNSDLIIDLIIFAEFPRVKDYSCNLHVKTWIIARTYIINTILYKCSVFLSKSYTFKPIKYFPVLKQYY